MMEIANDYLYMGCALVFFCGTSALLQSLKQFNTLRTGLRYIHTSISA